nr:DUF4169 family protein [Stappia sp. WLB 29]
MMSGDIVNLRQARKARARREKDEKAAQNRSLFGRSKAEKSRDRIEAEKAFVHIEGHRRTPSDSASGGTGEEH